MRRSIHRKTDAKKKRERERAHMGVTERVLVEAHKQHRRALSLFLLRIHQRKGQRKALAGKVTSCKNTASCALPFILTGKSGSAARSRLSPLLIPNRRWYVCVCVPAVASPFVMCKGNRGRAMAAARKNQRECLELSHGVRRPAYSLISVPYQALYTDTHRRNTHCDNQQCHPTKSWKRKVGGKQKPLSPLLSLAQHGRELQDAYACGVT